ncbi:PDDEXK-like family protein [Alteromonas sp. BMJM2]|uniref:PDDEXK-like family protein n=1 Tax=Alteromonas sp. BMJM2 TaxID=2954241 RepID=UPI0022B36573|nr:PD-(D/E)XK nuclease family protein [Alteromonas sp. BMJM2]
MVFGLERFFVNNEDVQKIESYLRTFNPLRVMKVERMEIRHSAILGWLLNPHENHSIGDWFLKAFLSEALKEKSTTVSSLDVYSSDLSCASVYIEHDNIDILIDVPSEKWVFIIENKVGAKQSTDQLRKYRLKMESRYKSMGYTICGIFLTLNDEVPDDPTYASFRYISCLKLLSLLLQQFKDSLSIKIGDFIGYYLDIIERECGVSAEKEKMIKLAKQLYREHKDVIDFVYEHGKSTEFKYAAEDTFAKGAYLTEDTSYRLLSISSSMVSFLPETWIQFFEIANERKGSYFWEGCEKYWSQYPFIMFIYLADGKLKLVAELGPITDHDLRVEIIHAFKTSQYVGIRHFGANATSKEARFSRFINSKAFTVKVDEDQQHDSEYLKHKIKELLNKAKGHIVDPTSDILGGLL